MELNSTISTYNWLISTTKKLTKIYTVLSDTFTEGILSNTEHDINYQVTNDNLIEETVDEEFECNNNDIVHMLDNNTTAEIYVHNSTGETNSNYMENSDEKREYMDTDSSKYVEIIQDLVDIPLDIEDLPVNINNVTKIYTVKDDEQKPQEHHIHDNDEFATIINKYVKDFAKIVEEKHLKTIDNTQNNKVPSRTIIWANISIHQLITLTTTTP
jgi:hypothetical protein